MYRPIDATYSANDNRSFQGSDPIVCFFVPLKNKRSSTKHKSVPDTVLKDAEKLIQIFTKHLQRDFQLTTTELLSFTTTDVKLDEIPFVVIVSTGITFASVYDCLQYILYLQVTLHGEEQSLMKTLVDVSKFLPLSSSCPSLLSCHSLSPLSFLNVLLLKRHHLKDNSVAIVVVDVEINDWMDDDETSSHDNHNSHNLERIVQIAWKVINMDSLCTIKEECFYIKPQGMFTISCKATNIHGINTSKAEMDGQDMNYVLGQRFLPNLHSLKDDFQQLIFVAHNVDFDWRILSNELSRLSTPKRGEDILQELFTKRIDTMDPIYLKIIDPRRFASRRFGATLKETLECICMSVREDGTGASKPLLTYKAHDALSDVNVCAEIFLSLVRYGLVQL